MTEAPSLKGLYYRAGGCLIVVKAEEYRKYTRASRALGFRPEEA